MKIFYPLDYLNYWELIISLLLALLLSSCQQTINTEYKSFQNYTSEVHQFEPEEEHIYIHTTVQNKKK